jgi:lycopene cyclase domain-containing protein
MGPASYLVMLGFVIIASGWLEWAFSLRVLRNPKKLFATVAIAAPPFIAWDAWAISQGHWFFDRDQMVGIIGPLSIPLEEYLFFVIIPVAAVLTLEGVNRFLDEWVPRFKK